ncbi:MAG: hypothetical protein WCH75_09365, partial [Candidatus Binatia bacterium]
GTNTLPDALFQTSPVDGDRADIPAQAANMYASFFEATKVWHVDNPIPFAYDAYGEVVLRFPAEGQDSCKTYSASMIRCRIVSDDGWVSGNGPGHEYGHVVQRRAWDGTTGSCGDCPGGLYERDGNESWSATSREYPNAAFKEGWADFAGRVAADSCAGRFDGNSGNFRILPISGGPTPIAPQDGKSYPRNVTKLLCDWYDTASDDDHHRSGTGDHFAADLQSIWTNMQRMFTRATQPELDAGLNVCDYIGYYVNDRKGAGAVGQDEHDRYRALIAELAYNNGIACDLPEPSVPSVPHGVAVEVTGWTVIRPDSPIDAVGRRSEVAIKLTWQDTSWNEDEFLIEASGAGIGNTGQWQQAGTVGRNKERFTDEFTVNTWILPLGERCYRVWARNNLGDSGSDGTTCITLAVPTAPAGLAGWTRRRDVPGGPSGGTVPIYEVHLSWTDRSDNEATFVVEKRGNGAGFELATTTGRNNTEAVLAGAPDETACFRVKGRNSFGVSAPSNEICLTS